MHFDSNFRMPTVSQTQYDAMKRNKNHIFKKTQKKQPQNNDKKPLSNPKAPFWQFCFYSIFVFLHVVSHIGIIIIIVFLIIIFILITLIIVCKKLMNKKKTIFEFLFHVYLLWATSKKGTISATYSGKW